jgi:RNA polymerase sigma-B factor
MAITGDRTRIEDQERAVNAFLLARDHFRAGEPEASQRFERCQEMVLRAFDNLIRHIARNYGYQSRHRESFDDLVQVGVIGMLTAMQEFDPGRGTPFAAFAATHIQYAIRHHLRDNTWAVHVPRGAKELRAQVVTARHALTERLERAPTVNELAEFLHTGTEDILQALLADEAMFIQALDDAPSHGGLDPGFEAAEVKVVLRDFLATNSPIDRQIFLLDLKGGISQRAIADRVGVSPSHVSRRIDALRREFNALLGDEVAGIPLQSCGDDDR